MDRLYRLEKRIEGIKKGIMVNNISELAIGGAEVMKILGIEQGPEVGKILSSLVEKSN